MKRSRFTEEQIIGMLREQEALVAGEGLEVADVFLHFGTAFRDRHGASLSTARDRSL